MYGMFEYPFLYKGRMNKMFDIIVCCLYLCFCYIVLAVDFILIVKYKVIVSFISFILIYSQDQYTKSIIIIIINLYSAAFIQNIFICAGSELFFFLLNSKK